MLGGYLHQDYDDEHGSADNAIDAFIAETTVDDRKAFGDEIRMLLECYGERVVAKVIASMGNFYDYDRDGLTGVQWIRRLAEKVALRT